MISGQLTVTASFRLGQVKSLALRLDRPPVARLFINMPPARVLATVPLVYTLCARAQTLAARAALAAAQGLPLAGEGEASALWLELLHEHLWRLLLDWPAALDQAPAAEAFSAWRKARDSAEIADLTLALLQDHLLGVAPDAAAQPGPDSLAGRCLAQLTAGGDGEAPPLPGFGPGPWLDCLQGRQSAHPGVVLPTTVAGAYRGILLETCRAALALAGGEPYPWTSLGEGQTGVAQTLTARGMLTHGVRLENGRVAAYHVWAPTDAFFADPQGLAGLVQHQSFATAALAQRSLERAVLALDPCVPYSVAVRGEG